jgi:quercetin dioxygenase-like cupin family protein
VRKISPELAAQRLTKPFMMASLVMVDNYLVSIYSCHGALTWHRHLDEDELFIGYAGTAIVETEWGNAQLGFSDIVRVPKGLPHRSVAPMPAMALLVQTKGLPERRNGHQSIFLTGGGKIAKVSVAHETAQLTDVYQPRRLTMCDSLGVSVQICLGAQQWHRHGGDQLVFCQYGRLTVEGEGRSHEAERGELVFIGRGEQHRVVAVEPATAVVMARVER